MVLMLSFTILSFCNSEFRGAQIGGGNERSVDSFLLEKLKGGSFLTQVKARDGGGGGGGGGGKRIKQKGDRPR